MFENKCNSKNISKYKNDQTLLFEWKYKQEIKRKGVLYTHIFKNVVENSVVAAD